MAKLVQRFVDDKQNTLSKPVKVIKSLPALIIKFPLYYSHGNNLLTRYHTIQFAAGYNRRGVEETKGKIKKEASEVLDQCPLLDRTKCFETVAAGVKDIVPDSVVDLKTPEVIYM